MSMNDAKKDNSAVVLTDEVLQAIEAGGAAFIRVPLERIVLAPHTGEATERFHNPRLRKGFDPDSMADLADAIAEEGLLKNILVRQVGDNYEIVAGERRTRAIKMLVEEDRLVKNLATGKFESASHVYNTVPALVRGACDDKTATRLAFMENDKHVPLSDADVIDLCLHLENNLGMSRKEQATLLGKSQAWLSHTHGFPTRLTPQNYEKLRSGEISRSVAQKLMEYTPEIQTPVIEAAELVASERHEKTVLKAEEEVETAESTFDQAMREHMDAVRSTRSTDSDRKAAKSKVERAEKQFEVAADKRDKVAETRPSISQSDVAEGAYRAGVTPAGNRMLNAAQVREHIVDPAKSMLDSEFDDEFTDPESGLLIRRRDLELVTMVANAVATGKRDLIAILREFYGVEAVDAPAAKTAAKKSPLPPGKVAPAPINDLDDEDEDEDLEPDDDDLEASEIDELNFDDDLVGSRTSGFDLDLSGYGDDDDD